MDNCPADFATVEPLIDRVLTQYRESPKLLHVMRTMLRQIEQVDQSICALPSFFDLDTAIGDQLTLLGKRLGFPRSHCICDVQPVFGFDCGESPYGMEIVGFCEGAPWADCADFTVSDISLDDDDLYRRFLKVRTFQMLALFDLATLKTAVKILFGDNAAVLDRGRGRVVIAPGRPLEAGEIAAIQVYPRVLPVGLGIDIRFHFGQIAVFGFGEGWGGFCDGEAVDGQPLLTEDGEPLLTEDGQPLLSDNLGIGADWMCEIDVRPYSC